MRVRPSHPARPAPPAVRARRRLGPLVGAVLLWGAAALFAAPLVWLLLVALAPADAIYRFPPPLLPWPPHLGNFRAALAIFPYVRDLGNTLEVALPATAGNVLASALAGYGFSRGRFPGRDALFAVCLGTLLLPEIATLVPAFLLFRQLHWINTYLPLIVPACFGTPFTIFLYRQFFLTLPRELEEAARIDGAGRLRTWWSVVMPNAWPATAVAAILSLGANWNSFLQPLIYLDSPRRYTLSVALAGLLARHAGATPWNLLMAATLLMLAPVALIVLWGRRPLLGGLAAPVRAAPPAGTARDGPP